MTDGTDWIDEAREVIQRAANHEEDTDWIEVREHGVRMRMTGGYRLLEDHLVPNVVELETIEDVAADPQRYGRVETTGAGPRVTELRFYCTDPDSHGVRQTDLRETEISMLAEDLVAFFMIGIEMNEEDRRAFLAPSVEEQSFVDARKFAGRLRSGKSARAITPQLLGRVAQVYRSNIKGYPTKAVEHHFQVSQRTAAGYVSEARKRGHLPPTKRGKKQA